MHSRAADDDAPEGDRPNGLQPMSVARKRLLGAGVVLGIGMVVVPFLTAAIGIATASRVPEGLRGATHRPEMKEKVGFAFSSTSVMALLAPPGVLLFVGCGLSLASERKRRADARIRERAAPPAD
jgi:hypothetical protein